MREHRLEVAGAGDRELFAPDTFADIFHYCGGVPRLINTLCDTAMMAAFTSDRDSVTHADIAAAVQELQWKDFAQRPHHHAAEAERLMVVKSCAMDAGVGVETLSLGGIVDAGFAKQVRDANYVVEMFNKGDAKVMRERLLGVSAV